MKPVRCMHARELGELSGHFVCFRLIAGEAKGGTGGGGDTGHALGLGTNKPT